MSRAMSELKKYDGTIDCPLHGQGSDIRFSGGSAAEDAVWVTSSACFRCHAEMLIELTQTYTKRLVSAAERAKGDE